MAGTRYCCLSDLLKEKKELVGAEIGVDNGNNAHGLSKNLDIKRLYLVDPYVGYVDLTQGKEMIIKDFDRAKNNARGLVDGDVAIWIYEKSEDAASKVTEKLDFVYIDASHQYDFVRKDLEVWYPNIKEGGIMAGHDFNIADVYAAVTGFCSSRDIKFESQENPEHEWWFKV